MADQVLVKGILKRPDDSPWVGATIGCSYVNFSTTLTTQHPSADLPSALTAADGSFSFTLWRNSLGDYASHYLFRFPNERVKRKAVILSTTSDTVELSQLLIDSAAPEDPDYPSLVALINSMLGGAFPTGGAVGQVLAIAQLTPTRVLTWATQDDGLPSGGALGEVLGITQASPRGVDWVNYIDGGTFN